MVSITFLMLISLILFWDFIYHFWKRTMKFRPRNSWVFFYCFSKISNFANFYFKINTHTMDFPKRRWTDPKLGLFQKNKTMDFPKTQMNWSKRECWISLLLFFAELTTENANSAKLNYHLWICSILKAN